jgi:ribosomal protein S27AE
MPTPIAKRCTKCGQEKPLTAFLRGARYRDGYRAQCRACEAAYMRQWRRQNLEYSRAKARRQNRRRQAWLEAYRQTPAYRQKQAVRKATYWAVQAGLIARKDHCERCGAGGPGVILNRHHPDYTSALRIVWLCTLCHGQMHWRLPG